MAFLADMIDRMATHIASEIRRRSTRTAYDAASWKARAVREARRHRHPPEAGLPVPAIPPKGPLPMQGGAEAPLDFTD